MGNGTSIGRVRGLGSAHHGAHHWIMARVTAVGNLVSVLFFGISLVLLGDYSFASVHGWLSQPLPAFMVALMIISTFWHAKMGMQVVLEDYVHDEGNKFACMLLLNLAFFAGAAFGLFSLARLVFTQGAA
ncbi:MAG: succinate dehydrogenase, hydrophobic membrane anchor protein [Erythrobacter sp.]|nr:succinate dehydrogenase, hydrophobic membrane anchor protein [Erythrobacter sp.]